MNTNGSIPSIVRNQANLYQGDLQFYFKIVFGKARNLGNPYHNFRHLFHVVWLCQKALQFYKDSGKITLLQGRILLIAAMFHDFDHPGRTGNDDLNIEVAIRGLRAHILPYDREILPLIEELILNTEFPHKGKTEELPLLGQIIRDADLSQALSVAWIQQIIFGLAEEMGKTPQEILAMQEGFLKSLHFTSEWAQNEFPPALLQEKITEVRELVALVA